MSSRTYLDEQRVTELWTAYKSKPTPALRATLADMYSYIVKKIVAGFIYKKPNVLDYEDLIQAGNIGLLDAIEKFQPEMGNQFQTYATIRVRGAILDEINSMDWTPRKVRENIRSVIKSIESHYQTTQTAPSVDDIAKGSEMEYQEARNVLSQMDRTYFVHMEHDVMEGVAPVSDVEKSEISSAVKIVMDTILTDQERQYIQLRFFGGYTNREIISSMGLTALSLKTIRESSATKLSEALKGYENFGG